MLRALIGLILIIMAAMMSNYLGPLYWALISALGTGLLFWGLDRYVQSQVNPCD